MPRVKLYDETEVLNKAMELFWRKGYNATSIQDLVEQLGINRASLYSSFGGKKQLFNEALENYKVKSTADISTFLNQQPSVKQGIRKLFENAISAVMTDKHRKGCFVVNSITELVAHDSVLQLAIGQHVIALEELFQQYLEEGAQKGEFGIEHNFKQISASIISLYNGVMVLAKIETDQQKLISTIDPVLDQLK